MVEGCVRGWGFTTVAISSLVAYLGYRYQNKSIDKLQSNILCILKSLPRAPQEFEFKVLKKATNNFDEKNKLGQRRYEISYAFIW